MGEPLRSPRFARALLNLLLPREEREYVIGDLEEMFAAGLTDRASIRSARRWYWRAAVTSVWSFRRQSGARSTPKPGLHRVTTRGDGMLKNLLQDARHGVRLLVRKPGFTIVALLTLALGIGANTAMFTVTHGVLLKPLAYHEPDQIVSVSESNIGRGWPSFAVAPANFFDWREQSESFAALAAWGGRSFNYAGGPTPERLRALSGTKGFLELLDGRPILGRGFRPEEFERGNDHAVVLAHGFWERAFGGRRDVVNESIVLNGEPYTIVGVMHPGWRFGGRDIALFTPRTFEAEDAAARGAHYLSVIGRLRPDVGLAGARAELTAIAARLEESYPATNKGWGIRAISLYEAAVGNVRPLLLVLLGAVGLVLLIACANLANMHLARTAARAPEIAIRSALGAGRGRIVQQLVTEGLVLSALGGAVGLMLAYWATSALTTMYPNLLPRSSEIRVDMTVLAFTAGLSAVTALLFGLMPALTAAGGNLSDKLKLAGRSGGGQPGRWLRSVLVSGEVALAVVLLAGAGLLLKSFVHLARVDPGFDTDQRLSVSILLPGSKYPDDSRIVSFYDQALTRVQAVPGATSVALTSTMPISGSDEIYSIDFEGRPPLPPGQGVSAIYYLISPGYFDVMGIPLLQGRTFTDQDRLGAPRVAIVNDAFVRLHYPSEDPIGQRIRMGRNSSVVREIVGVVGTVKHYGLTDREQAQMYEPFAQAPYTGMTFVLETSVEPTGLVPAIRREIQAIDPEQPVAMANSLEQLIADSTVLPRIQTLLLGAFAGIALLLAAVGLYGVMAYTVSQRSQEIGIRMALGASSRSVLQIVVRQAFLLVGLGLAIGLAGVLALRKVLASALEPMFFQVSASDTATLAIVSGVLVAVGLVATLVPARRATRVDPIQTLRGV